MKLALVIATILLLAGAFLYIKNLGVVENELKHKIERLEGVIARETIEHKNKTKDHNTIVNELADNGWLRSE